MHPLPYIRNEMEQHVLMCAADSLLAEKIALKKPVVVGHGTGFGHRLAHRVERFVRVTSTY